MGSFLLLFTLNLQYTTQTYTLNARQTLYYTHRVDVWRATETIDPATGQVGLPTWTKVLSDVPCMLQTGPSQMGPSGAYVVDESDNMFTLDHLRMPPGVDVRGGDAIYMSVGTEAGNWFTSRGNPQIRLRVPYQEVLLSRTPKPPAGVAL